MILKQNRSIGLKGGDAYDSLIQETKEVDSLDCVVTHPSNMY